MSTPLRPDPPERDPGLDAAWKAHSTELPPARLDAAILAAAHREARSRPRAAGDDDTGAHARGPSRAWWGLAAAATIGAIAFGIVQMAPEPTTEPPAVASDTPGVSQERPSPPLVERKADPAPVAQDKSSAPAAPIAEEPRVRAMPKALPPKPVEREQRRAVQPLVPPPEVAAPEPFPGVMQMAPSVPVESLAKREAERGAGARADEAQSTRQRSAEKLAAAAPARTEARNAAGVTAAQRDVERPPRTPEAWIEAIRELYAAQRFTDAARELNAFRAAYGDADARLPESLRAWAATVKRD